MLQVRKDNKTYKVVKTKKVYMANKTACADTDKDLSPEDQFILEIAAARAFKRNINRLEVNPNAISPETLEIADKSVIKHAVKSQNAFKFLAKSAFYWILTGIVFKRIAAKNDTRQGNPNKKMLPKYFDSYYTHVERNPNKKKFRKSLYRVVFWLAVIAAAAFIDFDKDPDSYISLYKIVAEYPFQSAAAFIGLFIYYHLYEYFRKLLSK